MDTYFIEKVVQINLENDDVGKEEYVEDIELGGIDVSTWQRVNNLCVIPREHRIEVLC